MVVREVLVDVLGDDELHDGVTQELHALVVPAASTHTSQTLVTRLLTTSRANAVTNTQTKNALFQNMRLLKTCATHFTQHRYNIHVIKH